MIAVLQRVKRAAVAVDGKTVGACDNGLCILLGVAKGDSEEDARALAQKIVDLRIFTDENDKMNLSLKDVDGMKKLLGFPPAPIFMLLADCEGVSTIPENDALGNVTQLMVKALTGQCGVYLEFYEFFEDSVIAGVPDYVPAEVTDGETTVMPAAFGELSEGILNVSKVKTGALTMSRLCYIDGKYYMHLLTGEGKTPPKWEEAGWTKPAPQLPGLEISLDDVPAFAENVMCQHYIISYGDNTGLIEDLCSILGIEII